MEHTAAKSEYNTGEQLRYSWIPSVIAILVAAGTGILAIFARSQPLGVASISALVVAAILGVFSREIGTKLESWVRGKRKGIDTLSALNQIYRKSERDDFSYDVFSISALNFDTIFRVPVIEPDKEFRADEHASFAGGSGANTAFMMAKLRARSAIAGVVGSGEFGRRMLRELSEDNIDTSYIVEVDKQSGKTAIISDARGQRLIAIDPSANLEIPKIFTAQRSKHLKNGINQSRILHVSSFVDHHKIVDHMEGIIRNLPDDLILSFVPGDLHSSNGLDERYNKFMLQRCDCLFTYENHFRNMVQKANRKLVSGGGSATEYVEGFLNWRYKNGGRKPIIVCLKHAIEAGKGHLNRNYLSLFLGTDRIIDTVHSSDVVNVIDRPVVDATGAGDAAAAGALIAILKGGDLTEIAQHAYNISLAVASRLGPRTGIEIGAELGTFSLDLSSAEH